MACRDDMSCSSAATRVSDDHDAGSQGGGRRARRGGAPRDRRRAGRGADAEREFSGNSRHSNSYKKRRDKMHSESACVRRSWLKSYNLKEDRKQV